MKRRFFTLVMATAVCSTAMAAPSRRPLPPEILDTNEDYQVLRDHVESRVFHLAPKRMKIAVSSLEVYSPASDLCDSVRVYQSLEKRHADIALRLIDKPSDRTLAQEDQLRAELKRLETELDGFADRLVGKVGEAKVTLELPASMAAMKKSMGFREGDTLHLPDVAALELSPPNLESVSLPTRLRSYAQIGSFEANWNVKPIEMRDGLFGMSTFPGFAELRAFPSQIVVTQPVSRMTYCALKEMKQMHPERPVIPIRVNYALALWEDERGPRLTEWVAYARKLEHRRWAIVSELPPADPETSRLGADPGEPRFYSGRGVYRAARFDVSFVFNKSVNKE